MARTPLSAVGEIVRRHDPDRFFTALFAPAEHRETLFTLYAFNHELARAREAAREPFAVLIRLQWWREVVEGAARRHDVANPLREALDAQRLDPALLAEMIDTREAEADTIPDRPAFEAYALGTAGALMVAAARALGHANAEHLRQPGAAYGIAGILRSVPALARQGRSVLPTDGTTPDQLRRQAFAWLNQPISLEPPALAAALPITLARRRLHHGKTTTLADRLAIVWAALRGKP